MCTSLIGDKEDELKPLPIAFKFENIPLEKNKQNFTQLKLKIKKKS